MIAPSRFLSIAIIVMAATIVLLMQIDFPWWLAGIVCLIPVHLLVLWAQLSPYSQWLGPVVTRFRPAPDQRELWLTIDDGPEPEETPSVLDALDRFGAKATFFLIGEKVAAHPELVREIVRRGHQIANHTWSHPQYWFWALPAQKVREEIEAGERAIRKALKDLPDSPNLPPLFRSPVGMKAARLMPILKQRRLHLIAWSARGRDGAPNPDLDQVFQRLKDGAEPGAILVLHEGRGHAPALLERLLPVLQDEAGFSCVIPSEDRWLAAGKPVVSEEAGSRSRR